MSLKGSFSLYNSPRIHNLRLWQFVLTNTNMLFSETFDVMLGGSMGQQPFIFRNITLKAHQSVAFNFDTVDWQWCQDDYAAIIDSNNRVIKKWTFHIKEYAPGECPECHGTLKCRSCHGKGLIYPPNKIWEASTCTACGGTGICHTCDIPRRKPKFGMGPTGLTPF